MRAVYYNEHGAPEVLVSGDLPVPPVKEDQVLVRVAHAGVNPIDRRLRAGELQEYIPRYFPVVPGWDFAGRIEKVGEAVSQWSPGDEVMGLAFDWTAQYGTYAGYVPVNATAICARPEQLASPDAAALPLVSLTAWQALTEFGKLQPSQRVLIQAGAGGVGSVAIQMAKHLGAEVFTTAGSGNSDYVRSLGADHCIDYTRESYVDYLHRHAPGGVDLVVEALLGDDISANAIAVVKDGGRVCFLNNEPPDLPAIAERGIEAAFLHHRPDGAMLADLVELFINGTLKVPPVEVLPLAEARKAHHLSQEGHTRGKLVLEIGAG